MDCFRGYLYGRNSGCTFAVGFPYFLHIGGSEVVFRIAFLSALVGSLSKYLFTHLEVTVVKVYVHLSVRVNAHLPFFYFLELKSD